MVELSIQDKVAFRAGFPMSLDTENSRETSHQNYEERWSIQSAIAMALTFSWFHAPSSSARCLFFTPLLLTSFETADGTDVDITRVIVRCVVSTTVFETVEHSFRWQTLSRKGKSLGRKYMTSVSPMTQHSLGFTLTLPRPEKTSTGLGPS